ncbi:MAG: S8 family peptidase, partial [Flavobacteriales bacterium]|nr:S8 family peptidase [Flavobacteriales bacterium]
NLICAANRMYENGRVQFAEPNMLFTGNLFSNPLLGSQWGINNTGQGVCNGNGTAGADANVDLAWGITTGVGIRIAILDQGIQMNHPDLNVVAGKDHFGNGNGGPVLAVDNHGTACAGIAAARDNAIGIIGVAPGAELLSGRIGSGTDAITSKAVKKAFKWAWKDQDADVISCSWGVGKSGRIKRAIKKAKKKGRDHKGCVIVFASGNENNDIGWPATMDQVIAVGASSPCDTRKRSSDDPTEVNPGNSTDPAGVSCDGETWWGSNFGPELDVVAPGVLMYTTDRVGNNGYNTALAGETPAFAGDDGDLDYFECFNGTSSAAPFAAGVCALILARNGGLTSDQVQEILESTADDIEAAGFDNESGHGRVNALNAVENICLGAGSEYDSYKRSAKNYKAYKFVAGQMFLVSGKVMLKVNNIGGSGQNMFAIQRSGSSVYSVSGYNYWIGTQVFNSDIRDVDYISGYTLVSLADGRIVKINGTGGSGQNMFAINEHSSGFTGVSGYSYYVGSHRFQSGIIDVTHIGGKTLLSFDNKKMLKVNGSGGSGFNLFAITESSNHFHGMSGYAYYSGEQKFGAKVSNVTNIGSSTFVCFQDGRMMKVSGSGGTGERMFNVSSTSYGFQTYDWAYTSYLQGSQKLSTYVDDIEYINSKTLFAFHDGKMMKVNGIGGTGQNMFNISESGSGFSTYSGSYTVYLSGHQKFGARATDIDFVGGNTVISFYDGRMLKVSGNGGTGQRMFNVEETGGGFQNYSTSYTTYIIGSTNFNASVSSLTHIDGVSFVALANGKWIKVTGTGGSGFNMFALAKYGDGFYSLCGYDYFVGCQSLTDGFYSRLKSENAGLETQVADHDEIVIAPNPSNGEFNIQLSKSYETSRIEVFGLLGNRVKSQTVSDVNTFYLDLTNQKPGIYLVKISNGQEVVVKRIIKQ